MKNIHVIPTNQSYLSLNRKYTDYMIGTESGEPYWVYTKSWLNNMSCTDDSCVPHNMFITSDEEIKEGDWCLNLVTKTLLQVHLITEKMSDYEGEKMIVAKHQHFHHYLKNCKKIILTTDQDLIKDGVQAIDDEFLEWFVKNPSCEYVEVRQEKLHPGEVIDDSYPPGFLRYYIVIPKEELKTSEEWQKQFPNTKVIDPDGWDRKNYQYSWFEEKITLIEYTSRLHRSTVKGIIPKEELKQETLEESSNKYSQQGSWQCPISFEEGAKWQAEQDKNKYSEEEVYKLTLEALDLGMKIRQDQLNGYSEKSGKNLHKEWFNQFKKK